MLYAVNSFNLDYTQDRPVNNEKHRLSFLIGTVCVHVRHPKIPGMLGPAPCDRTVADPRKYAPLPHVLY